jgi:aldoxime dehydratase
MVRSQGGRTRLRLYHEVSVAEPDEQLFCYVDCDEHAGLLAAASGEQPGYPLREVSSNT